MAYAIVHHFPGGTKEQYEASISAVHPSRKSLPKGQIFHAAGPSVGGWTIMAVHDSNSHNSLSRTFGIVRGFRSDRWAPAIGRMVSGMFLAGSTGHALLRAFARPMVSSGARYDWCGARSKNIDRRS